MLALGETDLLLPNHDYKVTNLQKWVDENIPAEEVMPWTLPTWPGYFHMRLGKPNLYRADRQHVKLCNYRNPPWGASRFGYGHFLASTNQIKEIRQASWGDGQGAPAALQLRFDSPDLSIAGEFKTNVYVLTYRPLGRTEPAAGKEFENGLYLVTVVDERYFWWFKSYPSTGEDDEKSWAEVIDQCGTAIGKTIEKSEIPAVYLKADGSITSRAGGKIAIVLDSVAANVGMHVVRTLDGKIKLQNAKDAKAAREANMKTWSVLAGGDLFKSKL